MYLLSLYFSRYVNWCQAISKKMPRWKINLAGLLFLAMAAVLIVLAPEKIAWPIIFVVGSPISVFFELDRRAQRERARQSRDASAQLRKTQKLLGDFKRK
jgi:cytochrome b561